VVDEPVPVNAAAHDDRGEGRRVGQIIVGVKTDAVAGLFTAAAARQQHPAIERLSADMVGQPQGLDRGGDRAGIRPQSVVVGINQMPVKSNGDYMAWIGTSTIGDTLQLDIAEGPLKRIVDITIAEMTTESDPVQIPTDTPVIGGLTASESGPGSPHYGRVQGLLVAGIAKQSPAQRAGLRPGDIITGLNSERMHAAEVIARRAEAGLQIGRVMIERGGVPYFVEAR
jgi:membrane-associated protease RseP (regulator of RpoE activity)